MRLTLPPEWTSIAVALSGGADSMALTHMLSQTGVPVLALTVDHGLRDDSAAEAQQVGAWVAAWPNLTHRILKWEGDKPDTRLMESARAARYALMSEVCNAAGITHLALAHHADDQAETFFMRLAAGSGLDGLAGMREMHEGEGVTLWRPLLNTMGHDDLVAYCRANSIEWIEDPTNANTAYTRNRLRQMLQSEGLTDKRLTTTITRLDRAADALRVLADNLANRATITRDDTQWTLDLNVLRAEPFELALRVIRTAIDEQGRDTAYGARFEKVEALAHTLLTATSPHAQTLGGCILRVNPAKATLCAVSEAAA